MVKYVSWASLFERDTGVKVRIVPESNSISSAQLVKEGRMLMMSLGKSRYRDVIEALEDYAVATGGPFHGQWLWVHSLANSGMFVRADSDIYDIYDIKPGVRFSVWDDRASVLRVPLAILDWAQVPHEEAIIVNSGSYDAAVRAVVDGRADIFWGFPTSPAIYEASSSPHGIRYIDMNGEEDKEGAARFRETAPMYVFGQIQKGVPEARGIWGTQGFNLEVTSQASDPELIYNIVKWLDENYDEYYKTHDTNQYMTLDNVVLSASQSYVPLHEGLIRYLKELGIWTAAHDRRQAENVDLITRYVLAYETCLQRARDQNIKIDPTNEAWINLWENYKEELELPECRMWNGLE